MTRKEAIQILADLIDSPFLHTWEKQNKALHMAIEALSAEAVQGEWIRKYDNKINCYWYECDQCGEYRPRNQFGYEYSANFCPNCGADMRNGM